MYYFRVTGKSVTFHKMEKKKKRRKAVSSQRYRKSSKKDRREKSHCRRWNHLLKLLYGLDERSEFFITLVYPQDHTTKKIIGRIRKDLNIFSNRFRYHYPNGWAIYSIEYGHKRNIHLHFIGRLQKKLITKKKTQQKFEKQIYKFWTKIISLDEYCLSNVVFFKDRADENARKGYLRKRKKKPNFIRLIDMVRGKLKYTHGVINRKNLPLSPKKTFKISERDFYEHIRMFLIEDSGKNSDLKNPFHKQNIYFKDYGFHILKNDKAFLKRLKKIGKEVKK